VLFLLKVTNLAFKLGNSSFFDFEYIDLFIVLKYHVFVLLPCILYLSLYFASTLNTFFVSGLLFISLLSQTSVFFFKFCLFLE